MKLAIAGKGGTGKTTLSAGLARAVAEAGDKVFAVDADSTNCLGFALGVPQEIMVQLRPLSDMKDILQERSGASEGGYFLLAPEVSDLLETHAVEHKGVRLLVMGTITEPGGGCVCPENIVLRTLTRYLVDREESVILDMEAGVEHLGRGTARHMDWLVVMAEKNPTSIRAAQRIVALASTLGIPKIGLVANRVRTAEDKAAICANFDGVPCLGALPYNPKLEGVGTVPWEEDSELRAAVNEIKQALESS